MSRIGNRKIAIPNGVSVTEENNILTVKILSFNTTSTPLGIAITLLPILLIDIPYQM